MGGLFDRGPSDGDIQRAEEKARLAEAERLRLMEIDLRRSESSEIIQGEGVASPENIVLGTDLEDGDTSQQPLSDPTGGGIEGRPQPLDEGFNFNDFGPIKSGAQGFGSGTQSGRGFGSTGKARIVR